jgi:hypothetical protein
VKKVVLNISDVEYEKFRFEAIHKNISVADVIRARIFYLPFHEDVEIAYESWLTEQLNAIMKEE